MKPIKQMKIELALDAIRKENDEIAERRRKRQANHALRVADDMVAGIEVPRGAAGPRGPFYSNRAMRRANGRRRIDFQLSPPPTLEEAKEEQLVKAYSLRDMVKAVRGLRRKV